MLTKTDANEITDAIKSKLIGKYNEQSRSIRQSVQLIQQNYNCCGMDGPLDFGKIQVPNSCCGLYDDNSFSDADPQVGKCGDAALLNKPGCHNKLVELIQENSKSFLIAIGCVFGFQILVVILSCVLSKSIREQYNVV